jgi:hypothetical protein
MNALESIVESSVDCRGGDNGVPLCPSPAVAPRNLKVVGGLNTAIGSRLGRLIAAVIFLESTDIPDKRGATFDCIPARRSFPPRTQAHCVCVQWRHASCQGATSADR